MIIKLPTDNLFISLMLIGCGFHTVNHNGIFVANNPNKHGLDPFVEFCGIASGGNKTNIRSDWGIFTRGVH